MKSIIEKVKNINLEDILCLFIILCPIFDMLSFIFRNTFETNWSPSSFLRPIIPLAIFAIVFFKNRIKTKMFVVSLIYGIYAAIHLYIFNLVKVEASYGGILNELQYLVNYTFMIMNLFLFMYLFWKKDCAKLQKSILIAFGIYIVSIYIAILTGTSSPTYIEGTGYKGWYESGNSLCAILCISLCIILPMLKNKKMLPYVVVLLVLSGIFLTTLVGTRTGLIGFGLIILLFIASECFVAIVRKANLNKKTIIISVIIFTFILILTIIGGSKTFERRSELKEIQVSTINIDTGKETHLSGDLLKIKKGIDEGEVTEEYLSKPMQKAIIRLYNYAEATKLENNDMRKQQLMYNFYLVQEQKSAPLMLFGNGFKAQFRELVMEMEIPAFVFNFGLIGFCLYFIPFLAITIYAIYIALRNIRKVDSQYIMYLGGSGLAIFLSFLSGYTFFNSSSMIIIITINVLLMNKILEVKEQNK